LISLISDLWYFLVRQSFEGIVLKKYPERIEYWFVLENFLDSGFKCCGMYVLARGLVITAKRDN
jgi:hypothetical protein